MRHRARYISQLTDKPAEFADIFIARRQAAASEHNNTAAGTDRLAWCTRASTACNNSAAQLIDQPAPVNDKCTEQPDINTRSKHSSYSNSGWNSHLPGKEAVSFLHLFLFIFFKRSG